MSGHADQAEWDFSLAYADEDLLWAEWIGTRLEDHLGYRVQLRHWDDAPGTNWVTNLHQGAMAARRTIVLVSEHSLAAVQDSQWQSTWARDPQGTDRTLLVVRLADLKPEGLLNTITTTDLFGTKQYQAEALIDRLARGAVTGRAKPSQAPFPGGGTTRRKPAADSPFPAGASSDTTAALVSLPPRERHFVGRESLFTEIDTAFDDLGWGPGTVVVLTGTPGIGKSRAAIEYAHARRDRAPMIGWLRGGGTDTLEQDFVALAPALGVPSIDDRPTAIATVRQSLSWGATNPLTGWLLVVDNLEPETFRHLREQLLPQDHRGLVLATARGKTWAQGCPVPVKPLTDEDSCRYLADRTGLPTTDLDPLAKELSGLPLALTRAACLLAEGTSVDEYLRYLAEDPHEVLSLGDFETTDRTVISTIHASLDRLSAHPGPSALLHLLSVLSPDDAPLDLLTAGLTAAGPGSALAKDALGRLSSPVADGLAHPLRRTTLVRRLTDTGLADNVGSSMSVHRLVQVVVRTLAGPEAVARWRATALAILGEALPERADNPVDWPRFASVLAQVNQPIQGTTILSAAQAELHVKLSEYLASVGDYVSALEQSTTAQRLLEAIKSPVVDQGLRIRVMTARAAALRLNGHYREAPAIAEDAWQEARDSLPTKDSRFLLAGLELAHCRSSAGQVREAHDLCLTLTDDTDRSSRTSQDSITARAYLASTLYSLGEYTGARTLQERVLTDSETTLGTTHPDTLTARANLATTLYSLGEYTGARTLQERVLTDIETTLGPTHPDTLRARANLATTLNALGERSRALALTQDVLTLRAQHFGARHENTTRDA